MTAAEAIETVRAYERGVGHNPTNEATMTYAYAVGRVLSDDERQSLRQYFARLAAESARAVRRNNAAAACLHHDRDNYIRECRTHDAADMADRWHKYRPIGSHPDPYRVER